MYQSRYTKHMYLLIEVEVFVHRGRQKREMWKQMRKYMKYGNTGQFCMLLWTIFSQNYRMLRPESHVSHVISFIN